MNHLASAMYVNPQPGPRFGVRRSALAEAGGDAALATAWLLLWLVFLLALAQPAVARSQPAAGQPAAALAQRAGAQPDPGPSARGVAAPGGGAQD